MYMILCKSYYVQHSVSFYGNFTMYIIRTPYLTKLCVKFQNMYHNWKRSLKRIVLKQHHYQFCVCVCIR